MPRYGLPDITSVENMQGKLMIYGNIMFMKYFTYTEGIF